jgi:hypothetical protein
VNAGVRFHGALYRFSHDVGQELRGGCTAACFYAQKAREMAIFLSPLNRLKNTDDRESGLAGTTQ